MSLSERRRPCYNSVLASRLHEISVPEAIFTVAGLVAEPKGLEKTNPAGSHVL
jgi:hypothetical protein